MNHHDSGWAVLGHLPFIAQVLNFFLLLWLLGRIGKDPIGRFLARRRGALQQGMQAAQAQKQAAEAKAVECAARLAGLDEELKQLRAQIVRTGETERQRIVAAAEEKAERMRHEAQALMVQQSSELREDIRRAAVQAAVEAAAAMLQAHVDEQDQQRLADVFLSELEGRLQQKAAA